MNDFLKHIKEAITACENQGLTKEKQDYEDILRKYKQQLALLRVGYWVACKDEMPEQEGKYLCYNGCSVDIYRYVEMYNAFEDKLLTVDMEVTHWMKLPEPPC